MSTKIANATDMGPAMVMKLTSEVTSLLETGRPWAFLKPHLGNAVVRRVVSWRSRNVTTFSAGVSLFTFSMLFAQAPPLAPSCRIPTRPSLVRLMR